MLAAINTGTILLALIGGGTLTAVGGGLFKLGQTMGDLTRAIQSFDNRLEVIEDRIAKIPPGPTTI